MKKQDWLLLAIASGKKKGLTPAQLQKSLFLLKQAYPKQTADFYNFQPYNYGPFDKQVYEDADVLAESGYITLDSQEDRAWSLYRITDNGKEQTNKITGSADADATKYLDKIVKWVQSLTFEQLIATIYKHFPKYKVNSVFRG
ncbi:MAG: hypothetical protein WDZ34_01755 [Candidatus Saccharimonadales bacterium]